MQALIPRQLFAAAVRVEKRLSVFSNSEAAYAFLHVLPRKVLDQPVPKLGVDSRMALPANGNRAVLVEQQWVSLHKHHQV